MEQNLLLIMGIWIPRLLSVLKCLSCHVGLQGLSQLRLLENNDLQAYMLKCA